MLVLVMIEILPHLGKYKYDTWRILLVKCYNNNSMCLQSCIRNINRQWSLPSRSDEVVGASLTLHQPAGCRLVLLRWCLSRGGSFPGCRYRLVALSTSDTYS
jgi:hypothetical protein